MTSSFVIVPRNRAMDEYVNNQPLPEPLTKRELDVLRLIADGRTTGEIAEELTITVGTVRWYAKQIYGKLGVHSRTQAALRARYLGLFGAPGVKGGRVGSHLSQANLPVYSTSFVGREHELSELIALLEDPQVRLVTIAGPGGIGKTRLCVEAARAQIGCFADGIYFIPLLALNSADEIVPAIARAMNLRLQAGDEAEEQLLRHVQAKHMLLVLDNFEQVLEGVRLIAHMLEATRFVKILATSITSLNVRPEWVRYLDGISYPLSDDITNPEAYAAVRLFLDRARRLRGEFSLADNRDCVIEICRLVGGMPLAIELATTWLNTLSCAEMVEEIRANIDFLATKQRDVDERHRSMRAVFDHSWRLLTDEECQALQRLSVLRGGFGRAAAEQVAGASVQVLSGLIDKSFLTQTSAGYFEMHDLLRQYAEEKLEQTAGSSLTSRSKMLLTWSWLAKGNFEKAEELAKGILDRRSAKSDPVEEIFGLALLGLLAGLQEDYERCLHMCTASRSLSQKFPDLHDPITSIFLHLGLTVASIGLEDYHGARHYIRSALTEATTLRSSALLTLCLPVMAILLTDQVETEQIIQLAGLAFTHRAGAPTWLKKWPPLAELLADSEAELGAEAFRAVWARGKTLELESVVVDLLKDNEP